MAKKLIVEIAGKEYEAEVSEAGYDKYVVRIGNKEYLVSVTSEGEEVVLTAPEKPAEVEVTSTTPATPATPLPVGKKEVIAVEGGVPVTVEVPGRVLKVLVSEGSEVSEGETIVTIESMKMELEIKSPKKGVVKKILVKKGDTVAPGDTVAIIE